ncbi:MAG: hypothetical protein QGH45_03025 [Myxococcota bacterium]|jgi:hypothetical protein|nr:hypothetical protein [Myxococcota bacterium]
MGESRARWAGVLALLVLGVGCPGQEPRADDPLADLSFRALTFNAGTTTLLPHGDDADGYDDGMAEIASDLYSNNLAWNPAEAALAAFLAEEQPEVALFQELFFDPWCLEIEVGPALDFVCQQYAADRPLQIERLLGDDYQVACAVGHPDNCVGVLRSFGELRECPADGACLDGLDGLAPPSGCTSGARVGAVVVDLPDGRAFTLVDVHASAGLSGDDMDCRVEHFVQVFEDRGDGEPAASGAVNLVAGDINTDPFTLAAADPSAAYWAAAVGGDEPFGYLSSSADGGQPTHVTGLRIDQVVSDGLTGECEAVGVPGEADELLDAVYWDHAPLLCDVTLPGGV